MIKDFIEKARSYRRFDHAKKLNKDQLEGLVELARLSPSGANRQPLKFYTTVDEEICKVIYESIGWAGYLKDWDGPIEKERPTGYILILRDSHIAKGPSMDDGIVAQSMFLGAAEQGIGACMIANIKRQYLVDKLGISDRYEIALILALGYPVEKVLVEEMTSPDALKYYRDEEGVHHVPKRPLDELLLDEKGLRN